MTDLTIKSTVAALAFIGSCSMAHAADVTLTLSHFMSPKSPPHVKFLEPWANKIAEESKGRIDVKIFPSMTLGGKPPELYSQVRDGSSDIILTITGYTPGVFPRSEVFELPTVHNNSALSTTKAITNNFDLVSEDYKKVHPLLVFANAGNAIHTVDGCITGPDDLKGKKIRTPSRTGGWLIEAWGADPVGMPVPDLPQALSKGTVNGALVPFEIMPPYKLHELTNCSVTNIDDGRYGASIFLFAMNKDRYDELPEDLKAVIDNNSGINIMDGVGQLFNDIEEPGKKLQAKTGSPVKTFDQATSDAMNVAAEKVVARWIQDGTDNSINKEELVELARKAITAEQ